MRAKFRHDRNFLVREIGRGRDEEERSLEMTEVSLEGGRKLLKANNIPNTVAIKTSKEKYTVRHKKLHPSYWYNNFATLCHTVMIFGI